MMSKANKRLAIAILAFLLVMCFCTGTLLVQRKFADAAGVKEQEAAFVEDQVLVTLTKEETRKFLDYSAIGLGGMICDAGRYCAVRSVHL